MVWVGGLSGLEAIGPSPRKGPIIPQIEQYAAGRRRGLSAAAQPAARRPIVWPRDPDRGRAAVAVSVKTPRYGAELSDGWAWSYRPVVERRRENAQSFRTYLLHSVSP